MSGPPAGRRLRAAVIGLGVGEQHVEAYDAHPACEVAVICDRDPVRLAAVHERIPRAAATTDADSVLADPAIDVVSICSYDGDHADQVTRALERDKHVMVEKPICVGEQEADRILAALRASGRRLTSNLILRRSPRFRRFRTMVQEGALGELFFAEADYLYGRHVKLTHGWRGDLPFYSVVYGGGVHVIDLLRWFVGSEVVEVFSCGTNIASRGTKFRFDDCVTTLFRFENGCVGKSVSSFGCVRPHFHAVQLQGTRGTLVNGDEAALWYRSADPAAAPARIEDAYPGVSKGALVHEFVDSLVAGTEPPVSERETFRTMDVCFAAQRSLESGRPMPVCYRM